MGQLNSVAEPRVGLGGPWPTQIFSHFIGPHQIAMHTHGYQGTCKEWYTTQRKKDSDINSDSETVEEKALKTKEDEVSTSSS